MHDILSRQLRRLELSADETPSLSGWKALLERVSSTYTQADQERYTLDLSQRISSDEMAELHERLREQNANLEREVGERTKSLVLAMEEAEAAAKTKAAFLANMSHEIRTPLNAVIGFCELLGARAANTDPAQRDEWLEIIHDSAKHLLELVNSVLDYSKLDAGMMSVDCIDCDVAAIVSDCVTMLQESALEKGISLQLTVAEGCPTRIRSDPVRLRQIVMNLANNAVKFTEHGGVLIGLSAADGPDGPLLRIAVRDTGIGMSPQEVTQLFSPFSQADISTTRRFGGTGLGLSIARELTRKLGGNISVESEPGVGSTFTALVSAPPAVSPETITSGAGQLPSAPRDTTSAPTLAGRRVLVVDDNATNLKLFKAALTACELDIQTRVDGLAAVSAAMRDRFDLIIMDMQMPVMDGFAATRRLRELGVTCPILAVTAMSDAEDRQRCLESGCTDHMSKPVDLDGLRLRVATLLGASVSTSDEFEDDDEDEYINELAADWLTEFPARLREMREFALAQDAAGIAKIAHAVYGTSGTLNLHELVEPADKLEQTALAGQLEGVENMIDELERLSRQAGDRLAA